MIITSLNEILLFLSNSILANYHKSTAQRFRENASFDELSLFSFLFHFSHCVLYDDRVTMHKYSIGKENLELSNFMPLFGNDRQIIPI